jgi:membrane-bound lytic murein transglycosylase D
LSLHLLSFTSNTSESEDAQYREHIEENYKVFSLATPVDMTFAGQAVPMDDFGIQERLDRELLVNTYWHSNTFLMFKRANRWFPVIEPILAKNNIPDDFKYLALVESGLTNAVSPAGATGFWQFMKETGKSYGLQIDNEVDERYHVVKSTEAACQYLNDAYAKFGDWALVAASYNMGMGGVNKQLGNQKVGAYWDLLLNEETGRYVFRILAVKEILNNSSNYGFVVRPKDLYEPYQIKTVEIDATVSDLAQWAVDQGVNYKILKTLNPWMRQSYLNVSGAEKFEVQIPA